MRHDLRKAARGRPCMYRAPGCDGGGETTVLAHIRRASLAGMGQKPPDLCGFWACANCHDIYDGRRSVRPMGLTLRNSYAFDALLRTLAVLDREEML